MNLLRLTIFMLQTAKCLLKLKRYQSFDSYKNVQSWVVLLLFLVILKEKNHIPYTLMNYKKYYDE